MTLFTELKLLLKFWLVVLAYIVFLGLVLQDWGRAVIQGILWGLVMAFVSPRVFDWVAERELKKSFERKKREE